VPATACSCWISILSPKGCFDALRGEETPKGEWQKLPLSIWLPRSQLALQAGSQGLQEVLTVWSVIKRKVLTRTYSCPL